jgi:hypothetical protein
MSPPTPLATLTLQDATAMYLAAVLLLMLVLPVVCIVIDSVLGHEPATLLRIGRWFVFWMVGVRLLLAGIRQIARPKFTARAIFRLQHEESEFIVRELGFANSSLGLIGLGSLVWKPWMPAAALAGMVFYALAGVNHIAHRHRSFAQSVAMVSDLFAAVVLAAALSAWFGY